MHDPLELKDGRIDVAEVMVHIREKVRRKQHDVEQVTAAKLQAFTDAADIDPDLLARLMAPGEGWNISIDYRIETHRRGLSGRLVVALKRLAGPLVRLYTDAILYRQTQLNLYLVRLCHGLVKEVARLQVEQAALRGRCDALERERGAGSGRS
jgi:hypothetical protein